MPVIREPYLEATTREKQSLGRPPDILKMTPTSSSIPDLDLRVLQTVFVDITCDISEQCWIPPREDS